MSPGAEETSIIFLSVTCWALATLFPRQPHPQVCCRCFRCQCGRWRSYRWTAGAERPNGASLLPLKAACTHTHTESLAPSGGRWTNCNINSELVQLKLTETFSVFKNKVTLMFLYCFFFLSVISYWFILLFSPLVRKSFINKMEWMPPVGGAREAPSAHEP